MWHSDIKTKVFLKDKRSCEIKFIANVQRLYQILLETKLLKATQNVEIRDLDLSKTQTEWQIVGYTDELSMARQVHKNELNRVPQSIN